MARTLFLFSGFLVLVTFDSLFAQTAPHYNQFAAPLLWVRFQFPEGTKTVVYPNQSQGSLLTREPVAAFRPGYFYRIKLTNLPDDKELFPTLEVRGSLRLPSVADPSKFQAPFTLDQWEIKAALNGSLITKVIYLEDPNKAPPVSTTPTTPVEGRVARGQDPIAEAAQVGRVMLIFRVGGRSIDEKEMLANAIPGTVFAGGDKFIGPPRFPPNLPIHNFTMADPKLGPKPATEELVYDGGDQHPLAGIDNQGLLQGVNPEDTVAEYKDANGVRKVIRSNRLLLAAPRFAVFTQEIGFGSVFATTVSGERSGVRFDGSIRSNTPSRNTRGMEHLNSNRQGVKPKGTESRTALGKLEKIQVLQAQVIDLPPSVRTQLTYPGIARDDATPFISRQRENMKLFSASMGLKGNLNSMGTSVLGRLESSPQVIYSTADTREAVMTEEEVRVAEIHKPLRLLKLSDKAAGQPGDIVTFTLRYQNLGEKPIVDLAVVDSLAGRLEYVPNSAVTDKDAVFTLQKNEAGSQILRWEITGKLMPKESGIIRFQVKVR